MVKISNYRLCEFLKNKYFIFIILIVLLNISLGLFRLGFKSFWGDEMYTVLTAGKPIGEMIVLLMEREIHPPLYYLVLHSSLYFGISEFTARFPSVIFCVLSLPVVFLIARYLFDKKTAILSTFIAGISPFLIAMSQEARSYMLFGFLGLLSIYFMLRSLKENKGIFWILFTVSTILAIYTHNYMVYFIFAANIFFIYKWKEYKHLIKKWILVHAFFVLAFFSVIFFQLTSASNIFYETYNLKWAILSAIQIMGELTIGKMFDPSYIILLAVSTPIFLILFLKGLKFMNREKKLFMFIFLSVPLITGFILAQLIGTDYWSKYFVISSFLLYIVFARGILSSKKLILPIFILFVVAIYAVSLFNYYQYKYASLGEPWRDIANYVDENSKKNELIILYPNQIKPVFTYYYKGDLDIMGVPNNLSFEHKRFLIANYDDEKGLEEIKKVSDKYDGFWLVIPETEEDDPHKERGRVVINWMDENLHRNTKETMKNQAIYYFGR